MLTLIPAYGRDYKSGKAVKADWEDNKDFIIQSFGHPYDGKYINKKDAETINPKAEFMIRFKQNRNFVIVKG